jgi:hypothetical protein
LPAFACACYMVCHQHAVTTGRGQPYYFAWGTLSDVLLAEIERAVGTQDPLGST